MAYTKLGFTNGDYLDASDLNHIEDGIDSMVSKTGNESITNVKTFTSSPIVPTPTTDMQAATKKYVDDNGSPADGWKVVTETWTYLSATSVTVPTGAASRYQKGDYIKLVQTTAKYFVVIAVTDTTLTLLGGSDYTVANAAITARYLSRQSNPFGFPSEFSYAASNGGFSAEPAGGTYRYTIKGGTCFLTIRQPNNGTSNSSSFTITLPVKAANISGAQWTAPFQAVDNGATPTTPSLAVINGNATTVSMYINYAGTTFTASGGKRCGCC